MTKLKNLVIQGYQSHVETHIPLSEGLTVITGPSGNGKTSVLRSLKWLATGDPSGNEFLHTLRNSNDGSIKSQAEETKVRVEMQDGTYVEKTRRKSKTTHLVSTITKPFELAETPQEVKDILGIHTYAFGDFSTVINFAYQLEAPFLLSESPSAGAKVLGKLAGTEAVDNAIKSVRADTYSVRQQRDKAESDIERRDADLITYLFLDDAIASYETCQSLMQLVELNDQEVNDLKSLVNNFEDSTSKIDKYKFLLEQYKDLETVRALTDRFTSSNGICNNLETLQTNYLEYLGLVNKSNGLLKDFKDLDHARETLVKLEKEYKELKELEDLYNLYTNNTQLVDKLCGQLEKLKDLKTADDMLQLLYNHRAELNDLYILRDDHKLAVENYDAIQSKTALYKEIPLASAIVPKLETLISELETIRYLADDLKAADRNITRHKSNLTNMVNITIPEAQEKLHEAWEAAGGVCPLCEQQIH